MQLSQVTLLLQLLLLQLLLLLLFQLCCPGHLILRTDTSKSAGCCALVGPCTVCATHCVKSR